MFRSHELASELETKIAASGEFEGSAREEEIRSLIAELREDFAEAARSREAKIRKILELHALTVNTPSWDYISKRYDYSDVSDRLDILATLYNKQGQIDPAISTLLESRAYFLSHQIPFDGEDILNELQDSALDLAAKGNPSENCHLRTLLLGRIARYYERRK